MSGLESSLIKNLSLCLNPCYSGICSVRVISCLRYNDAGEVLILVIVEYAL